MGFPFFYTFDIYILPIDIKTILMGVAVLNIFIAMWFCWCKMK
jgi:hypothetical protein